MMKNIDMLPSRHDDETTAQFLFRLDKPHHKRETRTLRGIFAVATEGARTRWGGEVVTASAHTMIDGRRVTTVGDTVRYPDGSEATISSGAGASANDSGHVLALVGSHVDNGDYVIWTPNAGLSITEFMETPTEGFLVEGYRHAPHPSEQH